MKRLFVVGLGPGGRDGMTLEAKKALEQSEVICGYTAYADLIRGDYPEKEKKSNAVIWRFWQRRTEKRRR